MVIKLTEEFLVKGHIREYKDIRELEISTRDWIHRILNKIRECEKYGIDYEHYIPDGEFVTVLDILTCCIDNKDNPNIKKVE